MPCRLYVMDRERRYLQVAIAVAGLVPVFGGLSGMVFGSSAFDATATDAASIALDSHVRYLSGLLFAIGVTFWCLIPTIERQTTLARVLTAIVCVGGLARLYGVAVHGAPTGVMLFALGMELVVTPLLCAWQARVARV